MTELSLDCQTVIRPSPRHTNRALDVPAVMLCSAKYGGPLFAGSGVWTGFNDHETHPGVPLSGVTNSAYVLLYVAQPLSA